MWNMLRSSPFGRGQAWKKTMTVVEEAWFEYRTQLFSFIRSRVELPEDAEDILNEVFIKLLKKANDESIPDSIVAWLYRVTRNSLVDYYRAKKRTQALPQDLEAENVDASIITQLSSCLLPMIQALPEIFQRALILVEIEGKKHQQVADELGVSLSATKSRILRGRERLLKSMVSCCTIYQNSAGDIVDYQQKTDKYCNDCDD